MKEEKKSFFVFNICYIGEEEKYLKDIKRSLTKIEDKHIIVKKDNPIVLLVHSVEKLWKKTVVERPNSKLIDGCLNELCSYLSIKGPASDNFNDYVIKSNSTKDKKFVKDRWIFNTKDADEKKATISCMEKTIEYCNINECSVEGGVIGEDYKLDT